MVLEMDKRTAAGMYGNGIFLCRLEIDLSTLMHCTAEVQACWEILLLEVSCDFPRLGLQRVSGPC